MTPGIYHVKFVTTPGGDFGEGLVVIKDEKVNGGDVGYVYTGSLQRSENSVTAKLHVKKWNPAVPNPLVGLNEYDIDLRGTANAAASEFNVGGTVSGVRIEVKGRKVADAV